MLLETLKDKGKCLATSSLSELLRCLPWTFAQLLRLFPWPLLLWPQYPSYKTHSAGIFQPCSPGLQAPQKITLKIHAQNCRWHSSNPWISDLFHSKFFLQFETEELGPKRLGGVRLIPPFFWIRACPSLENKGNSVLYFVLLVRLIKTSKLLWPKFFPQRALKVTELRWQRERKTQIFAEDRRFTPPNAGKFPAFGGRRKPQKTADFRRKPKIFAETAGNRRLGSVTLGASPKLLWPKFFPLLYTGRPIVSSAGSGRVLQSQCTECVGAASGRGGRRGRAAKQAHNREHLAPKVGHGEVGTGVSRGVQRTNWERSLKIWETFYAPTSPPPTKIFQV